ncbi:hypothetical protein LCGC14_1811230 [marine sediment metagenome]|uniref:Uncharacterized protein n=1 Tax=marine sediment metagenome TaxID=412755 RepID=A0A0F9J1H9_9ZZZZ
MVDIQLKKLSKGFNKKIKSLIRQDLKMEKKIKKLKLENLKLKIKLNGRLK